MPGVNGLQFMERLHAANCIQGNAAIVTGSFMKAENVSRLADLGVCMFQKPVALNTLYAWLNQMEEASLVCVGAPSATGACEMA